MRTCARISIFVLFSLALLPYPAYAATIHVPGDQPTIQGGIYSAVAGDLVLVAPGTYLENIDFLGKAITVQGEAGADVTVIDGDQSGSVVTFSSGETASSVLEGFTIRNGSGTHDAINMLTQGGGIFCQNSSPTITNCTVSQNAASIGNCHGGGIYCYNSFSTITNCTISENSVCVPDSFMFIGSGGGIYCRDSFPGPTIRNCTISENTAFVGTGGGININNTDMTIENCTISGNYAHGHPMAGGAFGGGIIVFCYGCSPTIRNCTISGNTAYDSGGGIDCAFDGTIENCTISNNSASNGGGINCYGHNPTIESCTISGNIAMGHGAGIFSDADSTTIRNCTISANTGNGGTGPSGEGIILINEATITNCLITGNSSDGIIAGDESVLVENCTISENGGRGIWKGFSSMFGCSVTVINSIVWENSSQEIVFGVVGPGGASFNISYSDVQGGEAAAYVCPDCTLTWGPGNIDADPLFVGGGNYHLSGLSPCIDAGTDAGVYDDIDGDVRPFGAGFDMGSDERGDCWDDDGDGYEDEACGGNDCDDTDSTVHPDARERCDGKDTNCDGLYYYESEFDMDGDGYVICDPWGGTDPDIIGGGDCDDTDDTVHPDQCDIPGNGVDDDCDGATDEPVLTVNVPGHYGDIQEAIDDVEDCYVVLVAPGTYVENIDFRGKLVTVRSDAGPEATIIDGGQNGSCVSFVSGETSGAVLDGFTVTNGSGTVVWDLSVGGGILSSYASPTVMNCMITGNSSESYGGGIWLYEGRPTITGCSITGNSAYNGNGGGIHYGFTKSTISNCTIASNEAYGHGGGLSASGATLFVTHCTIMENISTESGGGLFNERSRVEFTNSILWDDSAPEIDGVDEIWTTVAFSDVQGGWLGTEVIDADPDIVGGGDYHLNWGSPCIDAGIYEWVDTDIDGDPRPWGPGVDMGSDENTDCWDNDGDGYYDEACGGDDCEDWFADIHPGADERCDGLDNDCDGTVPADELDMDGDGYVVCEPWFGPGPILGGGDCDDTNPEVNPGVVEGSSNSDGGAGKATDTGRDPCTDGIDNDCDGLVDGDDPDCMVEFTLELYAYYASGYLSLNFIIGTPEPATWSNYLVLISPSVQVIPLWSISLPVIDRPMELPISFPFPSLGTIGIYTGLFTAAGPQAVKLVWVNTD